MRIRVRMVCDGGCTIPINYQEYLSAVVYRLLETSDAEFSRFLHDEGYRLDEGSRHFKLFVFSQLLSRDRKQMGDQIRFGPGTIDWLISSPVTQFLQHCATGLLQTGEIRVDRALLRIDAVETLPAPDVSAGRLKGACLSPVVAAVPIPGNEDGPPRYLRPADGAELSEALRKNLLNKRKVLTGAPPDGSPFRIGFDPDYLAKHRGGTKLIHTKGIGIVGSFAPFIAEGDPELLMIGYECGFGEKNASGFGMVEVRGTGT